MVVATASIVSRIWIGPTGAAAPRAFFPAVDWPGLLLTVAVVAFGVPLARALKIPAGPLLAPMVHARDLAHATRALPQILISIFALIAICAFFAWTLVAFGGIHPLTAYLATSPGGADSVRTRLGGRRDVGFSIASQLPLLAHARRDRSAASDAIGRPPAVVASVDGSGERLSRATRFHSADETHPSAASRTKPCRHG
nr:AbrB family transcriptional regulator [Hansschlegelia zhihuaiae]